MVDDCQACSVFWDVMQGSLIDKYQLSEELQLKTKAAGSSKKFCNLSDRYQRFGGIFSLHLQGPLKSWYEPTKLWGGMAP
jgi:hypothetical protein